MRPRENDHTSFHPRRDGSRPQAVRRRLAVRRRRRVGRGAAAHARHRDCRCRALQCRQVEPDQRAHRTARARAHLAYAGPHAGADLSHRAVAAHAHRHAGLRLCGTAKAKVEAWTALNHALLMGRRNLARADLLVDARHGLKPIDAGVLDTLDKAAVNYQIVLTKADGAKSADLAALVAATKAALAKHPAAHPDVLVTSARTGAGIAELRSAIARLIKERGAA